MKFKIIQKLRCFINFAFVISHWLFLCQLTKKIMNTVSNHCWKSKRPTKWRIGWNRLFRLSYKHGNCEKNHFENENFLPWSWISSVMNVFWIRLNEFWVWWNTLFDNAVAWDKQANVILLKIAFVFSKIESHLCKKCFYIHLKSPSSEI